MVMPHQPSQKVCPSLWPSVIVDLQMLVRETKQVEIHIGLIAWAIKQNESIT
jgi:hypothetical protein